MCLRRWANSRRQSERRSSHYTQRRRLRKASGNIVWIGIFLAGLAAYANSFFGPFIFDDLLSIPQNPTIHGFLSSLVPPGGGLTVSGRPILNLSFAFNYALSGDDVWSYHALNLLIHLLAGVTLFGIIRRTLNGRQPPGETTPIDIFGLPADDGTFVAFSIALLWTLHPLQTESVTYLVQRGESLMGLAYLLTLYCFIRGSEAGGKKLPSGKVAANKVNVWFVSSLVACMVGMATKEVMVSAPLIVLLYDRTLLGRKFSMRGMAHSKPISPYALPRHGCHLRGLVIHSANRGGTAGFGAGVGFWTYAATQFQAICHYISLSFWPRPLIIDYGVEWTQSVAQIIPYAIVISLLLVATGVSLVRRPALGFLGVCFFAILSPTSLIPGTRQTLAEHRMYLSLAPVMVLVVLAIYRLLGRRGGIVVAAAAIGLGCMTSQRNTVYQSDVSIWQDVVSKRPGNAAAHNNYGNILDRDGQPKAALMQYDDAIRIDPAYADASYDAGNTLRKLGRFSEAIARYQEALRAKPNLPDAQTALGGALEEAGRPAEAFSHYEAALRIDPNYTEADNRLGLALTHMGRLPEAVARFESALRINPNLADVHNNLGSALQAAGRPQEAQAQYEEALRLAPDYAAAHNNLGNLYRTADRQPEAIAQYELALETESASPEIHNNLGISLLIAGRTQDGIAQFESALRLNPNLAQVHLNLAIALGSIGRADEAADHYEAAKRLGAAVPEADK